MSCCDLHTTSCGQVDVCCNHCPSLRESTLQMLAAALVGVLLLVLSWVAAA